MSSPSDGCWGRGSWYHIAVLHVLAKVTRSPLGKLVFIAKSIQPISLISLTSTYIHLYHVNQLISQGGFAVIGCLGRSKIKSKRRLHPLKSIHSFFFASLFNFFASFVLPLTFCWPGQLENWNHRTARAIFGSRPIQECFLVKQVWFAYFWGIFQKKT